MFLRPLGRVAGDMQMKQQVQEQLAKARERLLDLTLRNRLLNFQPTKRTTVRIVDEVPSEIWRLLVEKRRSMAFLAREEHELFDGTAAAPDGNEHRTASGSEEEEEEGESFSLPGIGVPAGADGQSLPGRYSDRFLQTGLTQDVLHTNLLRTYQASGALLQERGVNYLFLAAGFLAWRPIDDPQREVKAPILLLPVALERTSARTRFELSALDDEPLLNPCLVRKLQDYRIRLTDPPEDWQGFDVDAYLKSVEAAVAGQANWRVLSDMYLGLFSFTKYLMYLDLDPQRWPDKKGLLDNALLCALCGDDAAMAGQRLDIPSPKELDGRQNPEDVFQVLDADSSQQSAIHAAKSGMSMVIHGPPGTGKSQTITNIIAECMATGKTVLFVSEKMAALEVVKRRLDQVGLGDFCLELHSTKANRKAVTAELERVLGKGRSQGTAEVEGSQKLLALKARLDGYVKALHEPLGPASLTPYQAMGRVALLKDVPDVVCPMPGQETWTPENLGSMKDLIEQLSRQLQPVWPVREHPWRGVRITSVTAQTQRTALESLATMAQSLSAAVDTSGALAKELDAPTAGSMQAMKTLLECARLIASSPNPPERLLREDLWSNPSPDLAGLLQRVRLCSQVQAWMAGRYDVAVAQTMDWQAILDRAQRHGASPFRILRPSFWQDRKELQLARLPNHRPGFAEHVADLKQLSSFQAARKELSALDETGRKYFDSLWHGTSSDWDELIRVGEWLCRFRKAIDGGLIGPQATELAGKAEGRNAVAAMADRLDAPLKLWADSWARLAELLKLQDSGVFEQTMTQTPCQEISDRIGHMQQGIELVHDWARYQEALQACESSPLAGFVALALADGIEPESLPVVMEKQFLHLWIEDAMAAREELRRFSAGTHEADRLAFANLDRRWVRQTSLRLQSLLAAERPAGNLEAARSSQLGILQAELRRVRGGRPIRKLLLEACDAIQRLKPCLMMSPLSVAQFVDPAGMRFDVVVFDEASQVEPPDALGAVARGTHLVLVGDPKQLPPTSFFNNMTGEGDAVPEDGAAGLTDMESILDRGTVVLPSLPLRWHYRSRHESLIAFSNREFYDNNLVVFPSSHGDTSELGLAMHYDVADPYDRGKSQTNRQQARRVAQWVFEHARAHADKSLGVGAFSQRQQQAILDEVEKLRCQDDSLNDFFDRNRPEPFFVKNLETIQGDERDVILLSVGYGRSQAGERVSMNFGPLNQDGGWRRLNVLVTRARERCIVFSSICGGDFDLSATPARGVHALKDYLDYAQGGKLPQADASQGQFASPFEQAVYNALTERGVSLRKQVGCAGYAIDLAVVDPDRPGLYVLGIECDGAAYHNSATARDRDRLRQQVLEGLGWRILRVWSTEWYRKPQAEVERVLDAIQKARAGLLKPLFVERPPANSALPVACAQSPDDEEPAIPTHAYEVFGDRIPRTPEQFYTESIDNLVGLVARIVASEGPIHRQELMRRAAGLYGLSRVGTQIEGRVGRTIEACVAAGRFAGRGEFLWPKGLDVPPVRRRDGEQTKAIEWICPEEIAQAARLVLKAQFGMNQDDLVRQTARLLGFSSAGQRISAGVQQVIAGEIQAGRLVAGEDGILKVASK